MKSSSIEIQIAKVYKSPYLTQIDGETVEELFNPILEDLEDGDYIELKINATVWGNKELKRIKKNSKIVNQDC